MAQLNPLGVSGNLASKHYECRNEVTDLGSVISGCYKAGCGGHRSAMSDDHRECRMFLCAGYNELEDVVIKLLMPLPCVDTSGQTAVWCTR